MNHFNISDFFEFFEYLDRGLYIADEVGVGKTIKAAKIISELINGDREYEIESVEGVIKSRVLVSIL